MNILLYICLQWELYAANFTIFSNIVLYPASKVYPGYLYQTRLLFTRLGICYLFYFMSRVLFFAFNRHHFGEGDAGQLAREFFGGFWFDSFTIAVSNLLFILLSLWPGKAFLRRWYQGLLKWIFMIANALFLAFNFIDVAYFPFTRKRSTADLFMQLGGQSDIGALLPQFVAGYWWLILCFAVSITAMYILYRRTERMAPAPAPAKAWHRAGATAGTVLLTFLAIRGGFQTNPIDIVNAGALTSPDRAAVVLNTPFTIIKTMGQKPLPEYHFFGEEELRSIFDPVHHFDSLVPTNENVVVILLESFSKEYCRLGRKKSFTPFFDSLMDHSLVFTNAFSNSSKSIEGIPSVLSSLPSYMELPFINSMYANNRQTSFATLLGPEGYETAFFHGGSNGTMNFGEWAALAGYRHYFGRDEYNNENEFDGYWGIWDEPFLQFCADKMSGLKQPFHTAVFTLSSHHPYRVPEKYGRIFPKGKDDFEAALRYADHSLRRFFETASSKEWFGNTLFILVADHAIVSDRYLSNPLASLTIPVVFYRPDNSLAGINDRVFTQADILPQAMYLLGYNKPFFSFGKDPSKQNDHITCYYGDGYHSIFTDSMLFTYNRTSLHGVYNYLRDSALHTNLKGRLPELEKIVERNFRAMLQAYNNTLNNNAGVMNQAGPNISIRRRAR